MRAEFDRCTECKVFVAMHYYKEQARCCACHVLLGGTPTYYHTFCMEAYEMVQYQRMQIPEKVII